jgi:hypothetical protein
MTWKVSDSYSGTLIAAKCILDEDEDYEEEEAQVLFFFVFYMLN